METVADILHPPLLEKGEGTESRSVRDLEDETLIAASRAGDDEAFRRLIERHQDRVYRFCFQWLRQAEDAREVCQDTFVRVYGSLARYRSQGSFTSWLLKIAVNLCRDRYRSRKARQDRDTAPLTAAAGEVECRQATPAEAASLANDLERIWQEIDLLPARLRDALIVCGVEGYSQEEAAEILGCSERAIEGRLYRARRQLEERLKKFVG